jgi:Zn-dependent protease with chaperone function
MRPYAIGIIVALAASGAGLAVMSAAAAVFWRASRSRLALMAPRARAQALAALRLLPATSAVAAASIVFVAFVRLEPADAREVLGIILPSAALFTAVVYVTRLVSASLACARAARAAAAWNTESHLIDSEFPIVAVVGIWRPRLYVARQVAAACDREELDAMIAHERSHIAARDNLTRLVLLCAPFALPQVARDLDAAWTRASEEAADDDARCDEQTSLALASALTKVARLAVGRPAPLLHMSAIFSGSSVTERVRRLMEMPTPAAATRGYWAHAIALAAGVAGIASVATPRPIYELAEYCVRYLP